MIAEKVIDELYKKYRKRPADPFSLDIPVLFDHGLNELHNITTSDDGDMLVIGSIVPTSPFHCLPLRHIHAIVPFENWVAIVLHSSIIFLNRKNNKSYIHLKMLKQTLGDRLGQLFRKTAE